MSRMTQSAHSSRPAMSSSIFSDPSSSLGLGGSLPAVSTSSSRFSLGFWSAALSEFLPRSTSESPIMLLTLKNWLVTGFLKSQFTSTTFLPACARPAARLAATVDLPSAGAALVTSSVVMSCWKFTKSRLLRSTRYASAAALVGCVSNVTRRFSPFSNFSEGMSPSTGASKSFSASSEDLMVLSRYS